MAPRSSDPIDLETRASTGEISIEIDLDGLEDSEEDLGTGDVELADLSARAAPLLPPAPPTHDHDDLTPVSPRSRAGDVHELPTRDVALAAVRSAPEPDPPATPVLPGVKSAPPPLPSSAPPALAGDTKSAPPPLPSAAPVLSGAKSAPPPLPSSPPRERRGSPSRPPVLPRARPWQSEADGEERALHAAEAWEDLCTLLLARLDETPSVVLRARLLLRLAGVLEDRLDDPEQAFDGIVEAYLSAPDDPEILDTTERLAAKLGRHAELVALPGDALKANTPHERIAHIANVIRWLEGPLARPDLATAHRAELARVDPGHPVILLREASVARERVERTELLQRALERTRRDADRAAIHRALGDGAALASEAFRHFSAAVELCPNDPTTLVAFEEAAAREERFEDAKWALEQLVRATDGDERRTARTRLAATLADRFLRHEEAARHFREVLDEAPGCEDARTGLERCYLALRDHVRLDEALTDRARRASSAEERGEAFALAAEIAEASPGGLSVAAEQWSRALDAMPTHRPYLERAANVAERAGEKARASEYRRRLVAVLDDPTARARELVALAHLTDDEAARQGYFERAVEADPSYALARDELRAFAAEGELLTSPSALRRAAAACDVPRKKARVLLKLAQVCAAQGDTRGAAEASAEAFRADPTNEHAAAKSLGNLIASGRHGEAIGACELLLAAAVREARFDTALFLLRELMKLSHATGEPGRALGACVLAMGTFPKESQPLVELVDVLRARDTLDDLDAKTSAAIDRLVARRAELPPGTACGLGHILVARGQHRRAITVVSTTLNAAGEGAPTPFEREALEVLATAYEASGELYLTATTRLRLARVLPEQERHGAFVAAAEVLYRGLGDPRAAVPPLEAALRLRPDDLAVLHTAMSVYTELREWSRLCEVVARVGALQTLPARRAKYLAVEAKIAEEELDDKARAAALYEDALDADKTRLPDFAALTRIYDDLGDYRALERSYRKMIARVRDDGDDALTFELFKRLSLVYSNRLGDLTSAHTALEAAKRIAPDDTSLKAFAVDMFVRGDELDRAVEVLRGDIARDPHDARSYERLLGVFARQGCLDQAYTTAQILSLFRPSSPDEARLLAAHAPVALADVPGCLSDEAWLTHLVHPDVDPTLTEVLEIMVRASRRAGRLGDTGPAFLRTSENDAFPALRALLMNACEILSMPSPSLVFRKLGGQCALPPGRAPMDALLVDVDAVRWASPVLPFLAGKRLAEKRQSWLARAIFADHRALKALASTGLDLGMSRLGGSAHPASRDVTPAEHARLEELVEAARTNGRPLDPRAWSQAVELSTSRVGLLLGQDVRMAHKVIASEAQHVDDLTPRRRLGELYAFAVSEEHAELRRALGIALTRDESGRRSPQKAPGKLASRAFQG